MNIGFKKLGHTAIEGISQSNYINVIIIGSRKQLLVVSCVALKKMI